jgi:hypothetical protein
LSATGFFWPQPTVLMRVAATPPFTTAAITAFAGCRRVRRVVQRHLERVCVEQSPLTTSSGA